MPATGLGPRTADPMDANRPSAGKASRYTPTHLARSERHAVVTGPKPAHSRGLPTQPPPAHGWVLQCGPAPPLETTVTAATAKPITSFKPIQQQDSGKTMTTENEQEVFSLVIARYRTGASENDIRANARHKYHVTHDGAER